MAERSGSNHQDRSDTNHEGQCSDYRDTGSVDDVVDESRSQIELVLTPIRAAMTTSGANTATLSTALECVRRDLSAQAGSGENVGSGLASARSGPRVRILANI